MNCANSETNIWIDAHCHLQDERLAAALDETMMRAQAAGVGAMVCCGSAEDDWDRVLYLATMYPRRVIPALGLHPYYLASRSEIWAENLRTLLRAHPEAGIGECGLDGSVKDRDDAEQERVLRAHFDLARQMNRPIWLHARRAWDRLPAMLAAWGPHEPGIVIHSYSGGPDLVPALAHLNVYFSFSGTLTRSNNRKGRASAAVVPAERILIETDSPDLAPVVLDSGTGETRVPEVNEPANLVHVAGALAEIRGWSLETTARITTENATRILQPLHPV